MNTRVRPPTVMDVVVVPGETERPHPLDVDADASAADFGAALDAVVLAHAANSTAAAAMTHIPRAWRTDPPVGIAPRRSGRLTPAVSVASGSLSRPRGAGMRPRRTA